MMANGILFVSHDATRSGAPTNLLHFLRWFKTNGNRRFSILLGGSGELTRDFKDLADTWSIDGNQRQPDSLRTRVLVAAGLRARGPGAEATAARAFAAKCTSALVYTNSIASARVIEMLAPQVPLLTHVHE